MKGVSILKKSLYILIALPIAFLLTACGMFGNEEVYELSQEESLNQASQHTSNENIDNTNQIVTWNDILVQELGRGDIEINALDESNEHIQESWEIIGEDPDAPYQGEGYAYIPEREILAIAQGDYELEGFWVDENNEGWMRINGNRLEVGVFGINIDVEGTFTLEGDVMISYFPGMGHDMADLTWIDGDSFLFQDHLVRVFTRRAPDFRP